MKQRNILNLLSILIYHFRNELIAILGKNSEYINLQIYRYRFYMKHITIIEIIFFIED